MNEAENMEEGGSSFSSEDDINDALLASLAVEPSRPKRSRKTPKKFLFTDDERKKEKEKQLQKAATKISPPVLSKSSMADIKSNIILDFIYNL